MAMGSHYLMKAAHEKPSKYHESQHMKTISDLSSSHMQPQLRPVFDTNNRSASINYIISPKAGEKGGQLDSRLDNSAFLIKSRVSSGGAPV